MGCTFVRRVRILLQTHRQEGAAYSRVRVCMEVYGSVIWRIEMSERVLVWSACCVYGPAKSIHSSLNGNAGFFHSRYNYKCIKVDKVSTHSALESWDKVGKETMVEQPKTEPRTSLCAVL